MRWCISLVRPVPRLLESFACEILRFYFPACATGGKRTALVVCQKRKDWGCEAGSVSHWASLSLWCAWTNTTTGGRQSVTDSRTTQMSMSSWSHHGTDSNDNDTDNDDGHEPLFFFLFKLPWLHSITDMMLNCNFSFYSSQMVPPSFKSGSRIFWPAASAKRWWLHIRHNYFIIRTICTGWGITQETQACHNKPYDVTPVKWVQQQCEEFFVPQQETCLSGAQIEVGQCREKLLVSNRLSDDVHCFCFTTAAAVTNLCVVTIIATWTNRKNPAFPSTQRGGVCQASSALTKRRTRL